ncbi:MAG TPA: 23S rRNA (pseudouridine(1915)-N(3))-methyltransferase RlmH [bacterium]|nr:23S rRNA (pseudouridine(1915)-N(3))-methyltransferase RlmH [bacterium]
MIYCAFIGSFKDKRLLQMSNEYLRQLERWWPVTIVTLPEKAKDIAKFIESKKDKGMMMSLDAHGDRMDSSAFIKWVTQSSRDIYFLGWGADGPGEDVKKLKLKSLSLSPMTFSHELARVLLLEQLYRAGATLKNHPYPK